MTIDINGVTLYVFKVDESHFRASIINTENTNAHVYTLDEIENKPYYNEVKTFLTTI